MKETILVSLPTFKIKAREHFWVKGIKDPFDLSGIVPLYIYVSQNYDTIEKNKDFNFSTGNATIVFSIKDNVISLITGWVGNRKKKMY